VGYAHLDFQVDRARHVATLTLNKPERLNAIDQQDKHDILDALARVQRDDDVWVVIWTDEDTWISRQGKALYAVDKPMIAAVNGVAAGAGFSLALCCDMRVGTPHTRFVTVFQERSLPPEGGMSFLLSRIVGLSRAMDLSLTSRRVEADEAYRIGLLDRLVEHESLMTCANEIADRICHLPPAAVRVTKRAIRAGLEASFAESTQFESRYGEIARRARADAKESADSFAERRAPHYKGR
jgi:2-(1,2-epoxy-1,2-dihydrophenyl)acetyl-CoA isomerase